MNTPKVLLFRGRGLVSALIRWQTRSPYSHAALLLGGDDNQTIIEAWQGAGVRQKFVTDWTNIDKYRVDGPLLDWPAALQFAREQIGKPYDYRQVFRFVTRRRGKDNSKWFCSELVFAALRAGGLSVLKHIEPWAVSPGLLSLSPCLKRQP